MEGMKIHWYFLTTSLQRLVQIMLLSDHATSALSVQACYIKVVVRFD